MSSASGLTRRRGGGAAAGGAAATTEAESSNGGINRTNSSSNFKDTQPETSYESSENGHKIAFDPRDISESTERSKQPKLTLMEEVLLLGLKDKQVRRCRNFLQDRIHASTNPPLPINLDLQLTRRQCAGLPLLLERQYILRPTWVHCFGACLPWPNQHAERRLQAAFSPSRPHY